MDKLSIIIPSYEEPYLNNTINSILVNAQGDYEILVNLDGKLPSNLINDSHIEYFHYEDTTGMRSGINNCIKEATGKYLMKCDAHCLFDRGFDLKLTKDMKDDWLMIPRRYSVSEKTWTRSSRARHCDYHYLYYPMETDYGLNMPIVYWKKYNDKKIDDTMIFQGSCWLAERDYFLYRVGLLDAKNYGEFGGEQIEIGLKYWLGGGEVKVNKNTWYAHLHKNLKYYKKLGITRNKVYKKSKKVRESRTWMTKHWLRDEEPGMIHKFSWLLEKFWPVPSWPEDKKLWRL